MTEKSFVGNIVYKKARQFSIKDVSYSTEIFSSTSQNQFVLVFT